MSNCQTSLTGSQCQTFGPNGVGRGPQFKCYAKHTLWTPRPQEAIVRVTLEFAPLVVSLLVADTAALGDSGDGGDAKVCVSEKQRNRREGEREKRKLMISS